MPLPNLNSIIDESYDELIKPKGGSIDLGSPDKVIGDAIDTVTSPDFKMPEPPAPAAQVTPKPEPSLLNKAGALADDLSQAVQSAYEKMTIPNGAQILFDFMNPSLTVSRKATEALADP